MIIEAPWGRTTEALLISIDDRLGSALDTKRVLLDYIDTQIMIYENKAEVFLKDEINLPNFHD